MSGVPHWCKSGEILKINGKDVVAKKFFCVSDRNNYPNSDELCVTVEGGQTYNLRDVRWSRVKEK